MTFAPFQSASRAAALGTLALVLGIAPASSTYAGAGALLSQCWSPAALGAKPGERKILRLDGAPDTKPVARDLLPFAPAPLTGSIRSVKIADGRKLIALTFDLCETHGQIAGYDGDIVDTLRQLGAKATFFAGGKWLLDHAERSEQLMADPQFELGNHNWSHANVRMLTPAGTAREIRRTQAAYESVRDQLGQNQCAAAQPAAFSHIPQRIGLYRFPYGACNAAGLQAVAEQGLLEIQWDIAMADPVAAQTADMIVTEVMHKVHPGAIIIGHANGHGVHTNEALRTLIPMLKAKGYQFVTVSELLAAGAPVVAEECYNEKPGDLDRYDHSVSEPGRAADSKGPRDPTVVPAVATSTGGPAIPAVSKLRGQKRSKTQPDAIDWIGSVLPGSG